MFQTLLDTIAGVYLNALHSCFYGRSPCFMRQDCPYFTRHDCPCPQEPLPPHDGPQLPAPHRAQPLRQVPGTGAAASGGQKPRHSGKPLARYG